MAVHPVSQHHRRALLAELVLLTHHLSLRIGEGVRQLLQQVGWSSLARFLSHLISLGYACTKENHLAPQVVALAPSDELFYFGFPFAAVCHVQHASLEEGYYVATEGEILEHSVLRHTRKVGVLFLQLFCQGKSLSAVYPTRRLAQILYVRSERLSEGIVVFAIYRHFGTDFPLRDGTEVDAADRSVGKHLREISLPQLDGGRCIPVEPDGDALGDTRCAHAGLAV